MKNNKIENLIEALYSVSMTSKEKKNMQRNLLVALSIAQPSPYQRFSKVVYKSLSVAFIAFLTIGSLSRPAAAGALPGEFLYPIKMIHEELESVSLQGSEEKVSHQIERTNRRIEEAEKLAAKRTLDPKRKKQLADNIKKHTENAKEEIRDLKIKDPIMALELNHRLQKSIESNVEKLKTKEDTPHEEVQPTEEPTTVRTVPTISEDELPINEMDIALSIESEILLDSQEESFNELLLEMEAELQDTKQKSEETKKDIVGSIVSPASIDDFDSELESE